MGNQNNRQSVFEKIFATNYWKNDESVSGHGSTLDETSHVRDLLPLVMEELGVRTLLDIPCGDFHWASHMNLDLDMYIGADIVEKLIQENNRRYLNAKRYFTQLDICEDELPRVDLILCRDLLGHFSNAEVQKALRNIKKSGAKYLVATTFPGRENNGDIKTGEWRPINLARLFGLPNPDMLITEGCTAKGFEDKSLGVWKLDV